MFRLSNKAGGGQGGGIPCSILVSVVSVFSDSCSGCFGPVVPVVSFRLFRVLVHAIPARCLPNMSENFTVRKCSRVFILQEDTFGIVLAQ